MKRISPAEIEALSGAARQSPRRRANLNLHPRLDDPVQRLAIAMEPDTVVQVHRHPQTFELLHALRGRFVVLHFDDKGRVTGRTVLGEECAMVENPAGQWHAVLSLDPGGVIFEVKHGPYVPVSMADTAPWSVVTETETPRLLDWYAAARVGDRFSMPPRQES
ncbi:MAG: WbuC family cupin fold metalloprotein [Proteobacteria bacterium]|nr:WbuC family cupin fold metalloprotein [Pseudomonadota bacterium]HQR03165.1 WbuC family cupin fold metalloprotein [Rhodocyclaceae bacterium]